MKQIHDFLKNHQIRPTRYEKNGNVYFIEVNGEKYAIKKNDKENNIYRYLDSRSFNYYPEIYLKEDGIEVMRVVSDLDYPKEQKMHDFINLLALLHSKTTFYKEIEQDYFEQIYEDIAGNITYLEEYYTDFIDMIEKEVYMRPSFYFLARNINLIFDSIYYAKELLERWHTQIQNMTKTRYVVIHNNPKLEHFKKDEKPYFISWNRSRIDLPIFDLYKLYKNHALEFDYEYLLREYEKKYPLKNEERDLLFILISLPTKLVVSEEMETCLTMTREIDLLHKTRNWISLYGQKEK